MKFKIETKAVVAALKTVLALSQTTLVTVTAKGKTLRIAAQGKSVMVALRAPATVSEAGEISIEGYMFSQTIKNRTEVQCELRDSQLVITGKSLTVKLVTAPVETVPSVDKSSATEVGAEFQEQLADAIARVGISNVHDHNPIAYRIALRKSGLTVIAADAHHVAAAFNPKARSKTALSFTLSADAFTTITTLADKKGYSFAMTDSEILAWSPLFELRIPTLVRDASGPTDEAVTSMVAEVTGAKADIRATVSREEFTSALDTMNGIFEGGANVGITTKDTGLELRFKTSYGEIVSKLKTDKARGAFDHAIDLPLTADTFGFLKGKALVLGIYNGNVLYTVEQDGDVQSTYLMRLVSKVVTSTKTVKAKRGETTKD